MIDWKNFPPNLEYLDLGYSSIRDSFVFHLSKCKITETLKTLKLRGTKISSFSLSCISSFSCLSHLDCKMTKTIFSATYLEQFKNLTSLSVDELGKYGRFFLIFKKFQTILFLIIIFNYYF